MLARAWPNLVVESRCGKSRPRRRRCRRRCRSSRKVVLAPEAMPDRCGATTPTAVEASGGLTIPLPTPATMKPGIKWVQELLPSSPVMSSKPTPVSRRPGPMSQRAGMCSWNAPANIDSDWPLVQALADDGPRSLSTAGDAHALARVHRPTASRRARGRRRPLLRPGPRR